MGTNWGPGDFEGGTPGRLAGRVLASMASCRLLLVWTVFQEGLDPQGRDAQLPYHARIPCVSNDPESRPLTS